MPAMDLDTAEVPAKGTAKGMVEATAITWAAVVQEWVMVITWAATVKEWATATTWAVTVLEWAMVPEAAGNNQYFVRGWIFQFAPFFLLDST